MSNGILYTRNPYYVWIVQCTICTCTNNSTCSKLQCKSIPTTARTKDVVKNI